MSLDLKFIKILTGLPAIDDQGFKQNSLAFNSKTRIISIASSDPAWFHATLSVVCLTRDLQDGVVGEPSRLGLFHRGEALSILKQRLKDSPTHIADTTIGAVATLANHEASPKLLTV
jgi:hypothetical protein